MSSRKLHAVIFEAQHFEIDRALPIIYTLPIQRLIINQTDGRLQGHTEDELGKHWLNFHMKRLWLLPLTLDRRSKLALLISGILLKHEQTNFPASLAS